MWENCDAAQVVVRVFFLLAEVAHDVLAVRASLCQYVKVKRVKFVSQILVVQEEASDVTQILNINFLLLRIELKNRYFLVSVDLVTWGHTVLAPG